MKNILEFSKQLLLENLASDAVVVDATLGNGHDTKFLCQNFKYVYSFDIQTQAIESSKIHLGEFSNFKLILDSHENISSYVTKCDGAIFNLGYLPNGNHQVSTNATSTISALKSLLNIIDSGIIVVVVYVGHDSGVEAKSIEDYISTLDKSHQIIKYQFLNRIDAPYILAIKI